MSRFALPEQRPDGLDSPVTAQIIKYGAKAHARLFRLTTRRPRSG